MGDFSTIPEPMKCPKCDGNGAWIERWEETVPDCCGNYLPDGQCCGNAVPAGAEREEVIPCDLCEGIGIVERIR